jgi:hypothetical protein
MSKAHRLSHTLHRMGAMDTAPTVATGALAMGGFALGAIAVCAVAVGAPGIGRLAVGRARFGRLESMSYPSDALL